MVSQQPLTNFILILDYDETVVHTFDGGAGPQNLQIMTNPKTIDLRDRYYALNFDPSKGISNDKTLYGIKRPHWDEFSRFIFSYFKLVIPFSAGMYEYVHGLSDELFKNTQEPHAILTRLNCTGNLRTGLEKPFWKILQDVPGLDKYVTTDGTRSKDNITNMFILDDRGSSFSQNPYNGILIPGYEPEATVESLRKDDQAFPQLMRWLMRPDVMKCTDVRKLDKSQIFV